MNPRQGGGAWIGSCMENSKVSEKVVHDFGGILNLKSRAP